MSMLPFRGNFPVTQPFGANPAVYGPGGHRGIDYGTPTGTPIIAVSSGVVKNMPFQSGGFGIYLTLSFGEYICYYGHLRSVVKTGAVKQGEVIGYTNNTGWSSGPHLHFEVYNNRRLINPETLLKSLGSQKTMTKDQITIVFRHYLGVTPTAGQYAAYAKKTFEEGLSQVKESAAYKATIASAKAGSLNAKNHLPSAIRSVYTSVEKPLAPGLYRVN